MKKLYDIRRTLFYKNNVGKSPGLEFKPIKYTFQGLAYSYGLDIISNGKRIVKIEPKSNGYFFVSSNHLFFDTKHLKTIQEVCSFTASKVWIYWCY